MRRNFIVYIFMIIGSCSLFAQQNQGTVSGSLSDSLSKQPLALATISIYKATDSALFTYRLSDPSGNFKISQLPLRTELRMIISYSGYKVYRKEFMLNEENPNEAAGTILMIPDARSLDEVLVFSERPPVIVKKDTIEFNASSFKTLPTALVEDLLKKLPGVDIDRDGNIVVNGKQVSRIMVDGKDFFGGDPKIATRNLPANIIDKVQVTDDKRELERNPMLLKEEISQVINLKLKKSIKKGWFGKAYAGSGTNRRNEAGVIINSFRDTLQVSTLAFSNNLNRAGFNANELFTLGGFQRTGVKTMMMTSSGGIGLNGISFGGIGEGIIRSSGGGININYSAKKNLNTGIMYFTGTTRSDNNIRQNTIQKYADTTISTREELSDQRKTDNHRLATKAEWTIDSLTNLWLQSSLSFSQTFLTAARNLKSANSIKGDLYNAIANMHSDGRNPQYNHELFIGRRQKKGWPGFVLHSKLDYSCDRNDKYTDAVTSFYPSSTYTVNQLQDRNLKKLISSSSLNIMRVYAESIQVNISNNLTTIANNDNLNVYELNTISGKYDVINPQLSNFVRQSGTKNSTNLTITKNSKSGRTFIAGVGITSLNLSNKFEKFATVIQRSVFFIPRIGIYLNKINISYSASVAEPNVADLQPVVDNTNPVFQVWGNPDLKSTYMNTISIYSNTYKKDKLLYLNISADASLRNNAIIRERWFDSNGIEYTRPVNRNRVYAVNHNLSVRKQNKFSNNKMFSWNIGNYIGYSITYAIVNKITGRQYTLFANPSFKFSFNWNDKIEISQGCNYSWSRTKYSISNFGAATVKTFHCTGDLVVRLPKKIVWESNVEYSQTNDITPGFRGSYLRWNAAVNFLFLKNDKGNLKLSAFDLLKQNAGVTRIVRENYIRDTEQSVLTRYFLLTFTYNIRDFKVKKIGGRDSFFMF